MKIEKATVKVVGRNILVNEQVLAEESCVARFKHYQLVKMSDDKFYLLVGPQYEGGFWDGVSLETKVAVELKKEFKNAKESDLRGPKLSVVVEAAYNMNLW